MEFEYVEDEGFFAQLLEEIPPGGSTFESLFDFRNPKEKRREFNRIRTRVEEVLINKYGLKCQLALNERCNIDEGVEIDHLIPLSSNKLNKEIRMLKAEKGRKVKTQSFGSNNIENLVLACPRCNATKKHRLLSKEVYARIFSEKI